MQKQNAITFFYYADIHAVTSFYEDLLSFELVHDQGLARIYRVAGNSYFGIVDGARGHLRHRPESAVLFTIVTADVESWHARLTAAGVGGISNILHGNFCDHFFFKDPAGYALEVQRFRDPNIARLFDD